MPHPKMLTLNAALYIAVPLLFLVILVIEIKSLFYNCSFSDVNASENVNAYEINANANSIPVGLRAVNPSTNTKYTASTSIPSLNPELDFKVVSSSIFDDLIQSATNHPRKRKMVDMTRKPESNSMQTLMNTWINGSYSPVHKHMLYSEAFVVLKGALAFFTYSADGSHINCNVLTDGGIGNKNSDRAIIVEKDQWHAMTAAPTYLGYPGVAIIFEMSGHYYDNKAPTKVLAPFAPVLGDGLNGDPNYFEQILKHCPRA